MVSPRTALLFGFLVLLGSPAPAADSSAVLQLFQTRYAQAHTLQVKFLERYSESGRFVRAEAGTAYFLRPGKMRWDYESPEKTTFLVDGKYVWFYSPADRTATRMPAKESEDWRTPLAFLTSHMKLSRLCESLDGVQGDTPAPSEPGDIVFRCVLREPNPPQSNTPSRDVLFEVSPDGQLRRIVVPQGAGMQLEFSFTAWQWNPALDKALFEFLPPRGVAIVNGLLPETPGLRQ